MNENYSRKLYDASIGDYEDLQTGYNCITGKRAIELVQMVIDKKTPDSSYSDYEVAVWEEIKKVFLNVM